MKVLQITDFFKKIRPVRLNFPNTPRTNGHRPKGKGCFQLVFKNIEPDTLFI